MALAPKVGQAATLAVEVRDAAVNWVSAPRSLVDSPEVRRDSVMVTGQELAFIARYRRMSAFVEES